MRMLVNVKETLKRFITVCLKNNIKTPLNKVTHLLDENVLKKKKKNADTDHSCQQ